MPDASQPYPLSSRTKSGLNPKLDKAYICPTEILFTPHNNGEHAGPLKPAGSGAIAQTQAPHASRSVGTHIDEIIHKIN
jgi:hypothetical protein